MDKKTPTSEFYNLGVAMQKLSNAMSQASLEFWQGAHSVCKFTDQLTYRQRFAVWILDTAERLANLIGGFDDA